jgi:hypothetical protein
LDFRQVRQGPSLGPIGQTSPPLSLVESDELDSSMLVVLLEVLPPSLDSAGPSLESARPSLESVVEPADSPSPSLVNSGPSAVRPHPPVAKELTSTNADRKRQTMGPV